MGSSMPGSPSFTVSQGLLRFVSIESVMPSNQRILCCLLLLTSIFPSIRVFSSESALPIRWPKHWSFIKESKIKKAGSFHKVTQPGCLPVSKAQPSPPIVASFYFINHPLTNFCLEMPSPLSKLRYLVTSFMCLSLLLASQFMFI